MKKTTPIFYALTLMTLLVCCSQKDSNSEMREIDVFKNRFEKILVSDIVESVRYVPLDNIEQALTGFIANVQFTENNIVVHDMANFMSPRLLSFDYDGKFVANIFSTGRAGNEIIRMDDFTIKGNEILVLDNSKKSINRYTTSGEYLGTQELPFHASSLSAVGNNYIFRLTPSNPFFIPETNYKVATVNEKFELIDKAAPYNSTKGSSTTNRTPFFVKNCFTVPFEEVMLTVGASGKIDSTYCFNVGEKILKDEDIDFGDAVAVAESMEPGKRPFFAPPVQSPKQLTLAVTGESEDKRGFMIYDKQKNISLFVVKNYVLDRDDMLKISAPVAYCEKSDEFVYITSKVTKEQVESVGLGDVLNRMSEQNREILVGDTSTSNFILVFVKFKDVEAIIKKYRAK